MEILRLPLLMAAVSNLCVRAVDADNLKSGTCKVQGKCNTAGSMLLQINAETINAETINNAETNTAEAGWYLLFRQTYPQVFGGVEYSKNPSEPTNDNFAILDQLESCKVNNSYTLKLSWPQNGLANQTWRQTSNPVTRTNNGVTGYEAIDAPWTQNNWAGLEKNGGQAMLDGSAGGMWWYAVGSTRHFGNGFPGPNRIIQQVELRAFCPQAPQLPTTTTTAPPTWRLVFRQTFPYRYNASEWSLNPDAPESDNYAILDQLESCRGATGVFRFKFKWPNSGKADQIWAQRSNPKTTVGSVVDYEEISVPHTENNWGGLAQYGDEALLDGSNGSIWYAVGARNIEYHALPGPGVVVNTIELYADCA